MFLIVGLGNPGIQYAYTRHNAGFLCVDRVACGLGFPDFSKNRDSLVSKRQIDGETVVIQKPQTFMNLSGLAVLGIVSFYKLQPESIFVIHDDVDLKPFDIRVKLGGSNGGHNGLRSIDGAIGKNYWRIRIGVGRPIGKEEMSDYVLSNFHSDEIKNLSGVFEIISANMKELMFAACKEDRKQIISNMAYQSRTDFAS